MRRTVLPTVSPIGQQVLDAYERVLRNEEDLTAVTIRNYLSDLIHSLPEIPSQNRQRAGRLLKEIFLYVLPEWEQQTVGA